MQMRNRLIIHVGAPKTGTTALQNTFYLNRDILIDRHGVLYPHSGIPGKGLCGHHNLVYEISPAHRAVGKFEEARGGWSEMAAEAHAKSLSTTLISAEGLLRRARKSSFKLKLFKEYDIKVVIYLRRQDEYLEAGYNQLARFARIDETFDEFVRRKISIVDYRSIVNQWQVCMPRAEIACVPFQKTFIGNDVVTDFSKRFLDGAPLNSATNVNVRAGIKSIAAAYIAKKELEAALGRDVNLSTTVASAFRKIFTEEFDDDNNFSFFSQETRRRLLEQSAEDRAWLAQRFAGFDSETFFDMQASEERPMKSVKDVVFTSRERDRINHVIKRLIAKANQTRGAA